MGGGRFRLGWSAEMGGNGSVWKFYNHEIRCRRKFCKINIIFPKFALCTFMSTFSLYCIYVHAKDF